jgi:hypothetical protein
VLKSYFKGISEVARRDAREESYYSTLEEFINNFKDSTDKKHIHVTTLPRQTEAGNPDFRIWDGEQSIVGYIEAKRPEEDLDRIERTEQLKRYRNTFPNLILTNFFEFRLYRDGVLVDKVLFAKPLALTPSELKAVYSIDKEKEFINLLEKFFAFSLPKTYTAKSLAIELAKRTRFLRDQVIAQELKEEGDGGNGFIISFYNAFQTHLIFGLTKEDFADLYSQTITYGLFAARTRSENGFNRKLAYDNIPKTIGILRDIFQFISLGDLPKPMEWIIDDISDVLATADVNPILHEFYHEGKGKDPIIHFYETFLAEYNPTGKKEGFADGSVTVLDPASGTLTFMAEAAKLAVDEYVSKYGEGGKKSLIKDHVLKNFYAFELMMAPYAIGHLKMSFDDRFKLYLTNTLEMEDLEQTALPGMRSLSEESHFAGAVKKETPILVIMGNPPYSGHSANKGDWISNEVREYYTVDGKPLGEKNPKWLQDDYVKFIRFAQWKIDQIGAGVLGFITNHSYLDNPTFRGMRQSLMKSFDDIYLLDLHGNSLKKERCPDGSKDENVFDIQQGVAIALFIKKKDSKDSKVLHADLWGLREDKKYKWLLSNDIKTTEWAELTPHSEFYLFVPRDEALLEQYEKYLKVIDVFPVNNVGIVTARDKFVFDFDKDDLKRCIEMLRNLSTSDEVISQTFNLKDKKGWKLRKVREVIRNDANWENGFTRCLYRPFDVRWLYYHDAVIERPRKEVMRHMIEQNLGLILPKRVETKIPWKHVLCTSKVVDHVAVSLKTIDYLFPLYLYPDQNQEKLINHTPTKTPNLNENLIKSLTGTYGKSPTPEEIFYYTYAVLYSNVYRTKYAEFLKTDFPRVPFTSDYDLFRRMSEMGGRLVDMHLMRSGELDTPIAKFQGSGENQVEKRKYDEGTRRVHINKTQYFEGIEKEVWEYQIGGYQVLDKWLKDRKGRELSLGDIQHYCKVVTALRKTMDAQKEIDEIYMDVEGDVIEFSIQTDDKQQHL